ncbi:hypothetical protein [Leuconostoc falkenbergense]|uniref:hypothetical protein n=1 Tax=Leuconostoc falkenbergense TaxID=2766470 RepID=UPI0024A96AF2|nr:hypothetical protein [Leuconostoc falkenbergense]MDI6553505.1 hypothetical protein [Leuconostoc falkenbergense]
MGLMELVETGIEIIKLFGRALNSTPENTIRYRDPETGHDITVNDVRQIGDACFYKKVDEKTGIESYWVGNNGQEPMTFSRPNIDDVTDPLDANEDAYTVAYHNDIAVDGLYDRSYFPSNLEISALPTRKVTTFQGGTLATPLSTYTTRFLNLPLDGSTAKEGNNFVLKCADNKLWIAHSKYQIHSLQYFRVKSHSGISLSMNEEVPFAYDGVYYSCEFDLRSYGITSKDMIDVVLELAVDPTAFDIMNESHYQRYGVKQQPMPEVLSAHLDAMKTKRN